MHRLRLLIGSLLVALAAGPARAAPLDGPALDAWLRGQVQELLHTGLEPEGAKKTLQALEGAKAQGTGPRFGVCTERLGLLATAASRGGLGLELPNADYFKAHHEALQAPAQLADPAVLEALRTARLTDLASVTAATELIEKKLPGAIAVAFASLNTRALDVPAADTAGRIVVRYRSPQGPQYVQLSVNVTGSEGTRRQASLLTFIPDTGTVFWDWVRPAQGAGTFEAPGPESEPLGNATACHQCHLSGPLAIKPLTQQLRRFFPKAGKGLSAAQLEALGEHYRAAIEEMNKAITREQRPGVVDAPLRLAYPPSPASIRVSTSDPSCSGLGAEVTKALASCTNCHKTRGGTLARASNLDDLFTHYLVGGFMPTQKPIPEALRKRAARCAKASYFAAEGALAAWLLEPCK